jgi:cyclin B
LDNPIKNIILQQQKALQTKKYINKRNISGLRKIPTTTTNTFGQNNVNINKTLDNHSKLCIQLKDRNKKIISLKILKKQILMGPHSTNENKSQNYMNQINKKHGMNTMLNNYLNHRTTYSEMNSVFIYNNSTSNCNTTCNTHTNSNNKNNSLNQSIFKKFSHNIGLKINSSKIKSIIEKVNKIKNFERKSLIDKNIDDNKDKLIKQQKRENYVKNAGEYIDDILNNLLEEEKNSEIKISNTYFQFQTDINNKMRAILIDWLIEVHLKFKLLPETLFLTINFIDRYLQNNQTPRDQLQLIAVYSLLIACKYEEIYPPEISSFVYITDNAYKKEEILDYEIKILGDLEYDLTYPTPLRFLEILVIKLNIREDNLFLNRMKYLIELCLSRLNFYQYSYLELVIGCCLLLCEKEGNINRSHNVIKQFKLGENCEKLEKIKNCVFDIKKLLEYINENKNVFKGVRQKYAMEKFGCVSNQDFFL